MTDSFQNIAVTSLPDITKIEFKSIHKQHLKVILVNVFLVFMVLYAVLFLADYYAVFEFLENFFWMYTGLSVLFSLILVLKIAGFKKRKYAIREKDISYKKGIFFRSLTTVPFNRIQHVEIDQAPISRFFGLAALSVFTAGDSSDDLKINGLLKKEAKQIKEFISNTIDG